MGEVVLIFPGQGAQYVGMGKELVTEESYKNFFDQADDTLGYSITDLCLNGPEDDLKLTKNTQPAIVTYSIALFHKLKKVLDENNTKVSKVLGHSVGEYSALVAAGVIEFSDAIKAVHNRGKYMQEAVPAGVGKMYAVLRVPSEIVVEACHANSTNDEICMPANFNEPGQIVISGHANACDKTVEWIKEKYTEPCKFMELQVSAPFHSTLMKPAEDQLSTFLNLIDFNTNQTAYTANIDASTYPAGSDPEKIKQNLIEQLSGSVLWSQSIQQFPEGTKFIEVGPGRVLFGLNRKINRSYKTLALDKEGAFDNLVDFLKD